MIVLRALQGFAGGVLIPMAFTLTLTLLPRAKQPVGLALFATSNFMNIYMTADYGSDQLFWPNVVRAIGQALVMAPLSAVATAGIEAENAGSASGLFNMMRNLGGAVGIAMLETFVSKREQYHSNVLTQSVSLLEQATRTRIEQLTQYVISHGIIDRADASHRAVVAIGHIVQKQAYILAFSDTFYLLGATLIVALMAGLLLKKPSHLEAGGAH
jgi:MFS transporter, DHA2 family, multidrug resistance protein